VVGMHACMHARMHAGKSHKKQLDLLATGLDKMAECEACNVWYHQYCMDIPNEVFDSSDVPWRCKECKVYDSV
jgi:hypothetical protein